MPKYKVGDVAALFPKPTKPKTESGKKIQALFAEFYNKPANPSKKFKKEKQPKDNQNQPEGVIVNNNVGERKLKKKNKKRKLQDSNIPGSVENAAIHKKAKLELETEPDSFPRHKNKKDKNSEVFLHKKIAKKMDAEDEGTFSMNSENGFPRTKSKEPAPFPRKKFKKDKNAEPEGYLPQKKSKEMKTIELENIFPESEKKKKAKKISEDPEIEPVSPKKKSKKSKKKFQKQEEDDSDFTNEQDFAQLPKEFKEQKSKVVFRMKKKRDIPSVKDIFPAANQEEEEENEAKSDSDEDDENPEMQSPKSLDKGGKRRKKVKIEDSEERVSRTLFVGNVAVSTKRKAIEKLFSRFGPLESCRLRGAVPTKQTIPKKVADIKGKYHKGQNSRIAYVVFKNRKEAIEAMSLSGTLVDGHHIVVDRASTSGQKKVYDEKRAIFVGNMPFDADDETLWSTFDGCGDIEAVRVVRDKDTGVGKGFGYVLFQKIQGKESALALSKVELKGRDLRVKSIEGGKKSQHYKPKHQDTWRNATKRLAFKKKDQKSGNPNSKKSLKKLMKRSQQQHQKKKIAGIFKKYL